ncbi:NAD(P)/FAD-dependent oxidoreductase [Vibrio rarus]|uniref:NAD(P)/FAD-dependent oxidoreductase n=1 Tax=Vibrio rarus TaxID=413403 RepID=UPI0021C340C6|nr:NAD(P)/FAD-dependent oxidoreductase [Vibrio rarus]
MDIENKQVVIIGAGPSGAIAAALLHAQNIDVLVIEKTLFPRFSIGESLLPACMEVIERAGMMDAVMQGGFQNKDGAAFRKQGRYSQFHFHDKFSAGPSTTWQVKRGDFDKILADSAQSQGVEIRYQSEVLALEVQQERTLITVKNHHGIQYAIQAQYVLDASGFGRILPKLLHLEKPSSFPIRKAIFTHIKDNICPLDSVHDRNKILVCVHPQHSDVWYWLIPFADGTCSLGVVAQAQFFAQSEVSNIDLIKRLVEQDPDLSQLLQQAQYPNPAGELCGYAANVKHLATDRYALLGNAGEFLDPVFSSGVTIAMKSAELIADCVVRKMQGNDVDWQKEYADPLMIGVNAFRTYVEGWYDGSFQDVIFHEPANDKIKQMICSILAGYAWDESNPYVHKSQQRLRTLAEIVRT